MVKNLWMRYAQNGGLKLVGNRNSVTEALLEDMTWLGSLDFPPLELGFGFANPTAESASSSGSSGHAGTAASAPASASASASASAETRAVEAEVDDGMEEIPHTPWGGVRQQDRHAHVGGVDPTLGNDNTVTRATLRRFGRGNTLVPRPFLMRNDRLSRQDWDQCKQS